MHEFPKPVWYTIDSNVPHNYVNRTDVYYHSCPVQDLFSREFDSLIIRQLVKIIPHGVTIAGGSVSSALIGNKVATDVDLFFDGPESFMYMYKLLNDPKSINIPELDKALFYGYKTNITENVLMGPESRRLRHITFKHDDPSILPIHLIKIVWYDSPEAVIDSFDFTLAQFAVSNSKFVYNPLGLIDLYQKNLRLHQHQTPTAILKRLVKYTSKGYNVNHQTLLGIVKYIQQTFGSDLSLDLNAGDY